MSKKRSPAAKAESAPRKVLFTGFPGFIGVRLLPRLLELGPDLQVVCLVQDRFPRHAENLRPKEGIQNSRTDAEQRKDHQRRRHECRRFLDMPKVFRKLPEDGVPLHFDEGHEGQEAHRDRDCRHCIMVRLYQRNDYYQLTPESIKRRNPGNR